MAIASAVCAPFVYSAIELARFDADARRATFIYGQALAPGVHVQRVASRPLSPAWVTRTRSTPPSPGLFRRAGGNWDIYLRGSDDAGAGGTGLVRLQIVDDRITKVTRAGQDVAGVSLEPEVLASAADRPGEDHKPVRLDETPRVLIDAVLAAEDHRFFEHGGVDVRALLRAAWANLRAGRVKEGGSTITQQLVKVRLLSPQRTFFRKLREAWLAAVVESRYSKERILEAYLNEIYLGQRGPIAIRGVGSASRAYFGKEVHQLTTPEAALIAAIIRGPNIYSPAVDPDRARDHRNIVLAQIRDLKMITPDEFERAGHRACALLARIRGSRLNTASTTCARSSSSASTRGVARARRSRSTSPCSDSRRRRPHAVSIS